MLLHSSHLQRSFAFLLAILSIQAGQRMESCGWARVQRSDILSVPMQELAQCACTPLHVSPSPHDSHAAIPQQ